MTFWDKISKTYNHTYLEVVDMSTQVVSKRVLYTLELLNELNSIVPSLGWQYYVREKKSDVELKIINK